MADLKSDPIRTSRTSVDKALDILDAFGGVGTSLSLNQVVEFTELPKATAHRLLSTLIAHGLVERDGARYTLGSRMFTLGNQVSFRRPRRLREVAMPYLCALRGQVRQTVKLGVLEQGDVLLIERLGIPGESTPAAIGARFPSYCTALGRVLLAHEPQTEVERYLRGGLSGHTPFTVTDPNTIMRDLKRIRLDGFAVERGECLVGLSCVAVPIFSPATRQPIAAISVGLLGADASPHDYLTSVQVTARTITERLDTARVNRRPVPSCNRVG